MQLQLVSLVLKFLKAGCKNINLNILKADFVKRNKCASLGTYFSGAPNDSILQNHLNIVLLNVI